MIKKRPGCGLTILAAISLLFAAWLYMGQYLLDPKQSFSGDSNQAVAIVLLGIICVVLVWVALRKMRKR